MSVSNPSADGAYAIICKCSLCITCARSVALTHSRGVGSKNERKHRYQHAPGLLVHPGLFED
eukprot:1176405-Prorocentrum_minimum.AAC.1